MAAEESPSPFRQMTAKDVATSVGNKVESFGRWLQKSRPISKEGGRFAGVKWSGLLVGICVVMVMSAAAITVLTCLIRHQLGKEMYEDEQIYGEYPMPRHLMRGLAVAGFVATGMGITAALFSLLASCCKSKWLLGFCMFLCIFTIVLSACVVAYGATAAIMEHNARHHRRENVWHRTDGHNTGYNDWDYVDHAVIEYFRNVANIWRDEVKRDRLIRDYDRDNEYASPYGPPYHAKTTASSKKSFEKYTDLIKEYRQKEEYARYDNVVNKTIPHDEQILSYMEDLLTAYGRLTDIYIEQGREGLDVKGKVQDCFFQREDYRRKHMLDFYRGLMAMGTIQTLMALFAAIILGKTCCKCTGNKSRKVFVIMRDPALGTPSTDDISSLIMGNSVHCSGMTVIDVDDREKLVEKQPEA